MGVEEAAEPGLEEAAEAGGEAAYEVRVEEVAKPVKMAAKE